MLGGVALVFGRIVVGKHRLAVELDPVVAVWQECLASGIFSQACPWEEAVRGGEWSWREMAVAGSEEACWRWASCLPRVQVLLLRPTFPTLRGGRPADA